MIEDKNNGKKDNGNENTGFGNGDKVQKGQNTDDIEKR